MLTSINYPFREVFPEGKSEEIDTVVLARWCEVFLPSIATIADGLTLSPVSGDAGFRNYFRLDTEPPLIAVYAPPNVEDIPGFTQKALFYRRRGIAVPAIYAVDFFSGFMLIEDLGDTLLLEALNDQTVDTLYGLAEETLLQIQSLPICKDIFPDYSEQKLNQEMALFPEWFIGNLLGISLDRQERQLITEVFQVLLDSAKSQPQVIVHRDFHSRNLLLQQPDRLGVIDFQDGVIGPISYDLVSLLRDCYIRWPENYVSRRVADYYLKCRERGLDAEIGLEQFRRCFDLMGLQRHFKVLGIFSRLWLRDGKSRYLQDLPLVMRYVLEQTVRYDELQDFHQWFTDRLMPVIECQPWYTPWQTAGDKP